MAGAALIEQQYPKLLQCPLEPATIGGRTRGTKAWPPLQEQQPGQLLVQGDQQGQELGGVCAAALFATALASAPASRVDSPRKAQPAPPATNAKANAPTGHHRRDAAEVPPA